METASAPGSSVGDNVYQRLKADITVGRLVPGERLRLDRLREGYSASVSTLREILNRLSAEGLVLAEGQRGFQVMPISVDDLKDLAALRLHLEKHAMEQSFRAGDLEWEGAVLSAHHKLSHVENRMLKGDSAQANTWKQYDWEFHRALVSACGSKALMDAFLAVYEKYLRYLMIALAFRGEITAGEHRLLFECALKRDIVTARDVLEHHINGCVEYAIKTGCIA
jgi:DNA-binding GntR family transcriptional regulator